jgi:hypothetical protein
VDGAIVAPSFVSSPWIRRYPHCRFSEARRTATRAMLRRVGGRPGLRRLLESYFLATSLRCQASSVGGVTGKMPVHCWRGMNRASAANQARSAGSYRTRPTCRRSTAFSCRSISSSASFAASPRNTRTPRQAILCCTRPANHHHASHAARNGRSTPPNRVFGRHKTRRVHILGVTAHPTGAPSPDPGRVLTALQRSSAHQSREQMPPLQQLGQAVDVTARIKHTHVVQGLISEYRRAA